MKLQKDSFYLGIDLNDKYAMISYFQLNMEEPETVSMVAGSEMYQVPLVLAKRKGVGQWYYGDDANKMAKTSEMICVDNLLKRAVSGESIRIDDKLYDAVDLLALYLRKLITLPQMLGNSHEVSRVAITVDRLTRENMEMFWKIAGKLGLKPEQFLVIDHKESFYYFALNQQEDLWLHDVFLFEYDNQSMHYYALMRNVRTTPQVISITESQKISLLGDKDTEFYRLLTDAFLNRIISTVYLVGEGFEGGWMKNSLNFLCRGKRAFMGKNLFTKGACFAAVIRDEEDEWPFVYMGENEMKFNLSLKVSDKGELSFYHLISAGKNWFESKGECEVILSGTPEIDFWKQLPNSREAKIETLELSDLPDRPDRTTRLRITAQPISDNQIEVTIKDLGFGEMIHSTDKVWKYTMAM